MSGDQRYPVEAGLLIPSARSGFLGGLGAGPYLGVLGRGEASCRQCVGNTGLERLTSRPAWPGAAGSRADPASISPVDRNRVATAPLDGWAPAWRCPGVGSPLTPCAPVPQRPGRRCRRERQQGRQHPRTTRRVTTELEPWRAEHRPPGVPTQRPPATRRGVPRARASASAPCVGASASSSLRLVDGESRCGRQGGDRYHQSSREQPARRPPLVPPARTVTGPAGATRVTVSASAAPACSII